MFALKSDGNWILSKLTGKRMTYSSRALARMAAKWIGKDRRITCHVVDA